MVFKKVREDMYENKMKLGKGLELIVTVDRKTSSSIKLFIEGSMVRQCSMENMSIIELHKATKTMLNCIVSDLRDAIRTIPQSEYNVELTQLVLFE